MFTDGLQEAVYSLELNTKNVTDVFTCIFLIIVFSKYL